MIAIRADHPEVNPGTSVNVRVKTPSSPKSIFKSLNALFGNSEVNQLLNST